MRLMGCYLSFIVLLAAPIFADEAEECPPLFISRGQTKVGIQPEIGGRVVFYQAAESGKNLIAQPAGGWLKKPAGFPRPPLDYRWGQDFGQVIWSGPQSQWWTGSRDEASAKKRGLDWPPDPDWTMAEFDIVEHSDSKLVLQSPISRLNGLRLTKSIECLENGDVRVTARATNLGKSAVAQDLWLNYRAPGGGQEYVPVATARDAQTMSGKAPQIVDGLHSIVLGEASAKEISEKAFLKPSAGWIAQEQEKGFLVLRFSVPALGEVAPGHAPVEIYRSKKTGTEELIELEQHASYAVIEPGQSIEVVQEWTFLTYGGPDDASSKARFLREKLGGDPPGERK